MSNINGFDNEFEFVKYLNGKRIRELNPMMREIIDELYPYFDDDSIIKCWRNHYKQKSDIFIRINGLIKGVSIKKGIKNSVHAESVGSFIRFLRENNVDDTIINEYLKYHYADGSIDGTGLERISADEYKINNQDSIDRINIAFNKRKLLEAAIHRFVIKGTNSIYCIDALIYGEVDNFVWVTKNDIVNMILSKKDIYSTAVHFGPMTCQPKARCLNRNYKYEQDRFFIQIKWYSLFDDIFEYMNNKLLKNANDITYQNN